MKKILILFFLFSTNFAFGNYYWYTEWNNAGNSWIGGWHIGNSDDYISGNFSLGNSNNNRKNNLLSINKSGGWAFIQSYYNFGWGTDWANNGIGHIGGWQISSNDIYLPLYRNHQTYESTQIFVKKDNCAAILTFNPSWWDWQTLYYNNCSGSIPNWILRNDDKYVTGNFDNSGSTPSRSELICFSSAGWAYMCNFNGYNWSGIWSNGGNNWISGWNMSTSDRYFSADVDGDDIDELVCINTFNGWSTILKYSNGNWNAIWSNGGNYNFGGWNITSQSRWGAFDFDNDKSEEIFCTNPQTGWTTIKNYNGQATWPDLWTNNGNYYINGWYMQSSDTYCFGNFYIAQNEKKYLLSINKPTGWSSLMEFYDNSAVEDRKSLMPINSELGQNFPNPFNPTTKITFTVSQNTNVKIALYDILGREIKTLLDEHKNSGSYEIQLDGSDLPSGIYIYKMLAGNFVQSRKLTIVK